VAEDKGLAADFIMPTMDDWEVFPREAAAVAMKAVEQGVALRTDITFEQEVAEATAIIARARGLVQDAEALGYIKMPEGSPAPLPSAESLKALGRTIAGQAAGVAGGAADKASDAAQVAGDAAQKAADTIQEYARKAAEAARRAMEDRRKS